LYILTFADKTITLSQYVGNLLPSDVLLYIWPSFGVEMVVSFSVPVSSCFDTLLTLRGIVGLFQVVLEGSGTH
jgi:hypothetical protein